MKKIIMLLSAALFAISCSDSDSPTAANNSGPVTVTETRYNDVTGAITNKNVYEYQDGKLQTLYFYSPSPFDLTPTPIYLQSYQEYSYDTNGKLDEIKGYNASGIPTGFAYYFYDSQQRLYKITGTQEDLPETEPTFTYNNDGSITQAYTAPDGTATAINWLVNANGYIYKQITDSATYELTFDGTTANVLTVTDENGNLKTYEYDTQHDPALTGILPIFGTYQPNEILGNGFLEDNGTRLGNKFVTKELINGVVSLEYQLQFDNAGRLTSRKTINAGGLMIGETVYEY